MGGWLLQRMGNPNSHSLASFAFKLLIGLALLVCTLEKIRTVQVRGTVGRTPTASSHVTPSLSPGDAWKEVSKSTLYKVCKIFNQTPPPPRVPHTWHFSCALPTRVHHLGEPLVNPLAHLTVHNTLYISQATTQFLLTVERKPA
eukprot:XP_019081238.1 PREDICTED: uncharacterized protein LOC109124084 [Vitis vinifera]